MSVLPLVTNLHQCMSFSLTLSIAKKEDILMLTWGGEYGIYHPSKLRLQEYLPRRCSDPCLNGPGVDVDVEFGDFV